ncbi:hypothetical protein [Maribellus mangrovi]|uniref:hypothetical protein n=1 Tax=Maribellus mangrovi TaxID=3133146 RepID=UPI0030EE35E4
MNTEPDDWTNLEKRLNAIDTLTNVYKKLEAQGLSHIQIVKKLKEITNKHNVPIELLYEVIGYPDGYNDNVEEIEGLTIEALSEIELDEGQEINVETEDVEFIFENLISHYRGSGISKNKEKGRILNIVHRSGKKISEDYLDHLLHKKNSKGDSRKFLSKILFVLSFLLSIAAIGVTVFEIIDVGIFNAVDYYLFDSLYVLLSIFGVFSLVLLVRQLVLKKIPSKLTSWGIGIFILCWLILGAIAIGIEGEQPYVILIFLPLIFIFYHFVHSRKHSEILNDKAFANCIGRKFILKLKSEWFKLSILIVIVIFLIMMGSYLKTQSQNGRYQRFDENQIIDTRTGNVYYIQNDNNSWPPFGRPDIPRDLK